VYAGVQLPAAKKKLEPDKLTPFSFLETSGSKDKINRHGIILGQNSIGYTPLYDSQNVHKQLGAKMAVLKSQHFTKSG
jgi:hypothetical protein